MGGLHRGFIGLADSDRNRRGRGACVFYGTTLFGRTAANRDRLSAAGRVRQMMLILFYAAVIAAVCLFIVVLTGWLLLKLDTPGDN